ncbi:MAG TPA: RNA polymerase sigma factor [Bacteroidota bacterium]|nr:RNA polymerase sigma factor [Bacteroidota bacterium]
MSPAQENVTQALGPEETSGLALRWRSGDTAALGEIVRRFQGPLLAYAVSLLGRLDEAEDVVQETWIRAHRGIGELRDPSGVLSWLRRIAHNTAIDAAKRARRRGAPTDPSELEERASRAHVEENETPGGGPSLTLGSIIAAIERLPETYREAAVYHYLQEWPYPRIAAALGIGEEAARQRVSRAGRLLRSALREAPEGECHDM